jgi:hypothetical protein
MHAKMYISIKYILNHCKGYQPLQVFRIVGFAHGGLGICGVDNQGIWQNHDCRNELVDFFSSPGIIQNNKAHSCRRQTSTQSAPYQ